jgi:polyphosphate kinase
MMQEQNLARIGTNQKAHAEAAPTVSEATGLQQDWNLDDPSLYLNRELTWLEFNQRVLHEAEDERTPLLERVKFLSIVSSNLDEFFMKRIGGLMQQVGAGVSKLTIDGRTPQQQIDECHEVVRQLEWKKEAIYHAIIQELEKHGIRILRYQDLTQSQQEVIRKTYAKDIYPLLTPQSIDPAHPFPFISNLSLNLLVKVRLPGKDGKTSLTRIKVPQTGISRFMRLPDSHHFIPLEEVVANNIEMLLPGVEILSSEVFRVTRNANTERDEEHADDLLAMIESELRDRKFAPIVRMQVQKDMVAEHRGMLAAELGLDEQADVFDIGALPAMPGLMEIAMLDIPELHDEPHHPVDHPELLDKQNIFHIIRDRGPLLLQPPYESFGTSVERFLKEASEDPKVVAIKMTLYRTSYDTKVVDHLIQAARNGKQVAVVVELKARFDEEANIRWANRMEEAGIHVIYGVIGLKTHSKIILVVRRDYKGIQRYLHIGTGNYHAGTARLYSDLGLFTADEQIGEDATELFNYLTTGYTPQRSYNKLLPSPRMLKKALLEKIHREHQHHLNGHQGVIQLKANALEDSDITRALYEVARDGVRVDMIIRDSCRIRPGLPGLSENVHVIGIVGRFLEHTRIYYFRNAGQEEYFIGSADLMKRNLESRVEVVTPVEDENLRKQLRKILDTQLADQRSAWEMQSDGHYIHRLPTDEGQISSQETLIALAKNRYKKAIRRLKGKQKAGA